MEGTAVAWADSRYVPIERISVGDLVASRDESSLEEGSRRVTRTWKHEGHRTVDVSLDTGERVRTTSPHRFFTLERGIVAAGELEVNDSRPSPVRRARSSAIEAGPAGETVYNVTVEGFHTYFVAHAGVWVHDAKQTSHEDPPPDDPDGDDSDRDDGGPGPSPPTRAWRPQGKFHRGSTSTSPLRFLDPASLLAVRRLP